MRYTWLFIVLVGVCYSIPAFAAEEDHSAAAANEVVYHKLRPSIITNLSGGPSYIRCDVQVLIEDATRAEIVDLHTPALRDEMLMLIVDRDGKELTTPEGKEHLRQDALKSFRRIMRERSGKNTIEDLYFTAYYVR
jgi:flagellar FliL protein